MRSADDLLHLLAELGEKGREDVGVRVMGHQIRHLERQRRPDGAQARRQRNRCADLIDFTGVPAQEQRGKQVTCRASARCGAVTLKGLVLRRRAPKTRQAYGAALREHIAQDRGGLLHLGGGAGAEFAAHAQSCGAQRGKVIDRDRGRKRLRGALERLSRRFESGGGRDHQSQFRVSTVTYSGSPPFDKPSS